MFINLHTANVSKLGNYLTLFLAGWGASEAPSGFSCVIAKRLKISELELSDFQRTLLPTFCDFFWTKSVQGRSPGHVSWHSFKKVINHAIGTVHVGSIRNLQDCVRSSVPIKWMSTNFNSGEPRSGHSRDLSIISLWGNMKMLPVSHKLTKPPNSFRIMITHPIYHDPGATDDRGSRKSHLRSHDVTIHFLQ